MARGKRGRPSKREIKVKDLVSETGYEELTCQAALDAGLVRQQIIGFPDEASLRTYIVNIEPKMALRFQPEPVEPEPVKIVAKQEQFSFNVEVMAGMGPTRNTAMSEQREIEAQMRRRNIIKPLIIKIVRNMTPNERGRCVSHVTIEHEIPIEESCHAE